MEMARAGGCRNMFQRKPDSSGGSVRKINEILPRRAVQWGGGIVTSSSGHSSTGRDKSHCQEVRR